EIALALHNRFRQVHNSPPMTLNELLSDAARQYAEKLAQLGYLEDSPEGEGEGIGENLSMGCSVDQGETTEEGISKWYEYNEVCTPGYTFGGGDGTAGTGHFTQVVWKGSTELGVGKASAEQHGMICTYHVARYKDAGNIQGEYDTNV
ncbi:predicted protein, partial [Nematostella vectensis]